MKLEELRATKSEQIELFKVLKRQKHALLIKEIKVEEMESQVKQRSNESTELKTNSSQEDTEDYGDQIRKLNLEDEKWQRQYRVDQMKMRLRAEALQEREKALTRRLEKRKDG